MDLDKIWYQLIFIATFVDLDALLRIFKRVCWDHYLFRVMFLVMGIVVITMRWRLILRNEPSCPPTFHANSISYMFKLVCLI